MKSKKGIKECRSEIETEEEKLSPMQNLGWANSWSETPDIVKKCQENKHSVSDVDVGPPNRGIEHVVKCVICRYVYRYDSSD
jgi:hypothetical protein